MQREFEWDQIKADENIHKHNRLGFEEAVTVFSDPNSITIFDPDHSLEENRYLDIGMSCKGRVLIVVYTERREKIRIISCRKETAMERRQYEKINT
jgi:uncharacterized DUF497 family protein